MSNDLKAVAQKRTALPSLVLAVIAVAFLLVSVARAEDPPIVSVGPVSSSGNTASGDVGSGGKATTCVNDEESQADPSQSSASAVKLNQGSCQEAGSSGSGGSQSGSGPQTGSGSPKPGSVRGTSGSTSSNASTTTASVAAAKADGLRIARVRHVTDGVGKTKQFRVLVTLKDLQGRLVRDAIVTISKAPGARHTVSGMCSAFTNRLGQATILAHVANEALGQRLFLKISARTPKARAIALRSLRLPAQS